MNGAALNPRWAMWLATKPAIEKPYAFIIWNSQRWVEWRRLNGVHRDATITDAQHAAFDVWLANVVAAQVVAA